MVRIKTGIDTKLDIFIKTIQTIIEEKTKGINSITEAEQIIKLINISELIQNFQKKKW